VAVGDVRPPTAAPERSLGLGGSVIKGRYRIDAISSVSRDVVVYSAEDVRHDRPITLKVLRDEFTADAQFVAAVRGQAGTLAMFAHVLRGVARVYDCDVTDSGEVFVALERTEGTTVREVLDTCGALAPSTALRVAIRVGEALEALHHHQIVHGQLGPDSVLMVTDSDGVERVKLLGVELTAAYRTPTGLGLRDELPPVYRAPEQIERGETTEASDVYALGMLLRELVTAARAGETTGALTARSPLPPAIERIIATALEVQPERRYPDISVMVNDMWGATTGLAESEPRARPMKPKPPADLHRRERRGRPHFTPRTIAIVATAGIIAVAVWVAAFDRIVSRLPGRVTPSSVTVVPVEEDATSPGAPSSASATPEEAPPPESRAVEETSAVEEPAAVVAKPLVAPVIVREPVAAPAAGRGSGAAVESRTPPTPRTPAERPPRRDRADTDVGDGSAAIDWLLQNRR
jgi:serine/threonine protein kinase